MRSFNGLFCFFLSWFSLAPAPAQVSGDPHLQQPPSCSCSDCQGQAESGASDEDLLKALESENRSDRQKAQQELLKRGVKNRKALLKMLQDDDKSMPARIAALGVVQSFWNKEVSDVFVKLLAHPLSELRRAAVEGLAMNTPAGDRAVDQALEQILNDEDLGVRRAVVLAIGKIGADGSADTLVNALKGDDTKDHHFRDGILRAIEQLGKPGIDALLVLSNSGQRNDLDLVVATFLALRTRPAADALPALLKNYHLTGTQRAALIRSYDNYRLTPPVSLSPVVDYLALLANQVKTMPPSPQRDEQLTAMVPSKLAALEVLSAGKELASERGMNLLFSLLSDEDNKEVRIAVIKAAAHARLTRMGPALTKMMATGVSQDPAERRALLSALTALQEKSAIPVLEKILGDKMLISTPEGRALQADALRALGLIDAAAAQTFARSFLEQGDRGLQKEALTVLGSNPAGAKLAAELFLAGKLPRELRPQVAEILRHQSAANPELMELLKKVNRPAP